MHRHPWGRTIWMVHHVNHLWSADRPLASAASTPVAAACSTKTWQASVTWVATLAPKASTSRASWGGSAAATFATFDGLGEGLGAGVWPLPLRGGGGIRLNLHHVWSPLRLAFSRPSPLGCTRRTQSAVASTTEGGGSYPPTWWMSPPLCSFCHTSLPVYSPSHKKHTLKRK